MQPTQLAVPDTTSRKQLHTSSHAPHSHCCLCSTSSLSVHTCTPVSQRSDSCCLSEAEQHFTCCCSSPGSWLAVTCISSRTAQLQAFKHLLQLNLLLLQRQLAKVQQRHLLLPLIAIRHTIDMCLCCCCCCFVRHKRNPLLQCGPCSATSCCLRSHGPQHRCCCCVGSGDGFKG